MLQFDPNTQSNSGEPREQAVEPSSTEDSSAEGTNPKTAADSGLEKATSDELQAATPPSDYGQPVAVANEKEFKWNEDDFLVKNYCALGRQLALTSGDLYRNAGYGAGLNLASSSQNIEPQDITHGCQLAPIIADRLRVRRYKNNKLKGNSIPNSALTTALANESFLQQFLPLDNAIDVPFYLPNYDIIKPGYNDFGPGMRYLYNGPPARIETSYRTITQFLDAMAFASNADRTNCVAAALTIMLRNFWLGGKPVVLATATKSHAGKDTVIMFAGGRTPHTSVMYEEKAWAVKRDIVGAIKSNPKGGVIVVENARLEGREHMIASAFLEMFITDPNPFLFSTGTGAAFRRKNDIVIAISTNFGTVSTNLMNRALPIHLAPVGDVFSRVSAIGNPKCEFLPQNCLQIEAELRGMIEKWKLAGCPLDTSIKHAFSEWGQTIGGILMVNGFTDFLGNYSLRRTADDPLRKALGLLGAATPNIWLRPAEWAQKVVDTSLVKALIPENDRDSENGKCRGIGVVLSHHKDETFSVETDDHQLVLKLRKKRFRANGESEPATRYCFVELKRDPIPEDAAECPVPEELPGNEQSAEGESAGEK